MIEILFTVLFLGAVQSKYQGDSCFDNNMPGVCTAISECEPVLDEIRERGQTRDMRRRLNDINCGFKPLEPLVCCVPKQLNPKTRDIEIDNRAGSVEVNMATMEWPPDIQDHPNLHLLPRDCGSTDSNRLFGGKKTALYEMPWMVLLSYKGSRTKFDCGGTIINQWYILTAAHCVKKPTVSTSKRELVAVVLGEYDVRTDPDCEGTDEFRNCAPKMREVGIDEVIAHTGYTGEATGHRDDIALIRLAKPADFNLDTMKPICLPVTRDLQKEVMEGIKGIVAGWGLTETGLQSSVLLSVDLTILRNRDCNAIFKGDPKITAKQMCAGGVKGKDSCFGDSGGSLVYPSRVGVTGERHVQRGIVSFGSKRCAIGFPGVYTRIVYYMDWILDNLRD